MKKLISLLLALALVLSILPATLAAPAEKGAEDIVILYTNDVHTYIDKPLSYDNIADMKTTLAAENAGVLLVDAGDHIQGTAFGSMDKGETIIELMNAAGYDLATLGNHEFDYGMERALELVGKAEFPYVSANFYHEKDGVKGETVLDAYKVFEIGGKKIALIGITTPESFTKSTPAYFQDENGNYIYGIGGGTDGAELYADVQAAIDAASAEADYVIALGHCGDDPASKPWTSEEVIANTTGLDAFIDGHSHSTVPGKEVTDKGGNNVLLTQTGEYFGAIGKMTIGAEGITTELVTEWTGSNADVAAIKTAWTEEVNTLLGEVIGSTELTLDNYDAEGNRMVRKYETNTGDFCADALYWLFDSMDMDVDVAIMNGGGVRNKAVTGEVSYLTCKNIHTFGNVACLQTVTGQQIIDALEWGARQTPVAEVGGFLHVSGLTYKVESNTETTVQQDDKGVWIGGPTGEYRVHDVKIYDKETNTYVAIDPEAEYNLAGYNYTLRDLGDGFAMFDGAVNVLDYVMEDYQVLATYVKAFEDGKIEATNSPLLAKYPGMLLDYGTVNGSGRIEVSEYIEKWDGVITIGGLEPNLWTTKYGNVYTDCSAEHFTEDLGLAWGDLATVKFLDKELVLPVVPDYSYVDSGKPALLLSKNEQGNPTGYAFMAINMGNFLETYGIAYKGTDADGNWYWTAYEGVEFPIVVTFELYEKGGYMAEYLLHELNRTNNREDYPDLTDEEFANFREVTTNGMGDDTLYRSSSPINPEIGRNTYADAAMEAAGVKTVINLADSETSAAAYPGFAETYYSQQNVIYLNLGVDFAAEDFQEGLANGLRFMIANEGPYLVHCTEGKDRAGFVNAVLECLMGATIDEVIADYMVTYYNYYGVEPGTEKYDAIANSNILKSLATAFENDSISSDTDMSAEAEEYLLAIGLTEGEIVALRSVLGPRVVFDSYVEEVTVDSSIREEGKIPAYITFPGYYTPGEEWPVVFMIHGHGGNHNEWGGYDTISDGLAENGIIAVTLDFPGCGASTESFTLNTMTNMKQDVLDVIAYVCENYSIDQDRIGGFGYSMGGRIILELTAEELYEFDTIEFVAPAEDLEDLKNLFGGAENWEVLKAEANENGFVMYSTIYSTLPLSKEWFADLEKYPDGLKELAAEKYTGNSMVFWATDDAAVSPWVSEGVAETFNSAILNVYTAGHSYGFYADDPYVDRVTTEGSVGYFVHEFTCTEEGVHGYVKTVDEHGCLVLTVTAEDLAAADIELGDTVTVKFGDVWGTVTYAETVGEVGSFLVEEDGKLVVKDASMENLAEYLGFGSFEDGNWYYAENVEIPMAVAIVEEPAFVNPFTDVPDDVWYTEYVLMMAEAGIIKGMTETTFEPETNLTRAQLVTMLYRLVSEPSVEGLTEPFTDVPEGLWYTDAVIFAYNVGLVNGVTETTFEPDAKITREQLVTILYRLAKAAGADVSIGEETNILSYPDAEKISPYAVEALQWAVGEGILNGITYEGDNEIYLAPQGLATRAQAAKLIVTFLYALGE